jgi:hypothetical protein
VTWKRRSKKVCKRADALLDQSWTERWSCCPYERLRYMVLSDVPIRPLLSILPTDPNLDHSSTRRAAICGDARIMRYDRDL